MSLPRVLFILKKRAAAGGYDNWSHNPAGTPLPSGLSVSASQMVKAITEFCEEVKLVQVIDNNCIDREVSQFKPTHVIIEAFWVVPEKFDILKKLHPKVKWIIRNHSKCDFLSHEGGMIGWALDYIKNGQTLGCNSIEATLDIRRVASVGKMDFMNVAYLPNFYDAPETKHAKLAIHVGSLLRWIGFNEKQLAPTLLHVACPGAIRPLKNHLHQAMAAMCAAELLGSELRFYINSSRVEGKAEPILNSIRQLFNRFSKHTLVEIPWLDHEAFTKAMATMDIVLQVSNSETFNIVAADAVAAGVPVVGSDEIPWLPKEFHADPNNVESITAKILYVWRNSRTGLLQDSQLLALREYAEETKHLWKNFLQK
jgi:glycosyltransferase involved in cell wall biosynthesis